MGGSAYVREPQRAALTIGVLMNVRGLMILIILNSGLERRSITLILFAIMVMLALCTTLMASRIYELVQRPWRIAAVSIMQES